MALHHTLIFAHRRLVVHKITHNFFAQASVFAVCCSAALWINPALAQQANPDACIMPGGDQYRQFMERDTMKDVFCSSDEFKSVWEINSDFALNIFNSFANGTNKGDTAGDLTYSNHESRIEQTRSNVCQNGSTSKENATNFKNLYSGLHGEDLRVAMCGYAMCIASRGNNSGVSVGPIVALCEDEDDDRVTLGNVSLFTFPKNNTAINVYRNPNPVILADIVNASNTQTEITLTSAGGTFLQDTKKILPSHDSYTSQISVDTRNFLPQHRKTVIVSADTSTHGQKTSKISLYFDACEGQSLKPHQTCQSTISGPVIRCSPRSPPGQVPVRRS